jgi:hypothetical protein
MSAGVFGNLAQLVRVTGAAATPQPSNSMSLLGALVITLSPFNPTAYVLYIITWLIMTFAILGKKGGKRQLKKGALYALPMYIVLAMPLNFIIAKILPSLL